MKHKILLSCYAICILLMSVILMWRTSSGYVFAYEYNSMNGKENADGETYLNLSIGTDNPFIASTDSDIIAAINGGYTGYIYFGYPTCPYCRNTVSVLMDEFKEKLKSVTSHRGSAVCDESRMHGAEWGKTKKTAQSTTTMRYE